MAAARVRGREGDVGSSRRAVSPCLAPDAVEAEVVASLATEEDVLVAFELALAQHGEPELGQRGLVHAPTRREIAHPEPDVVEDNAHAPSLFAA